MLWKYIKAGIYLIQNIRGENVGMLDRSDFTSDNGLRDLRGENVPNDMIPLRKKCNSKSKLAQAIHNIPFLPIQPPSRTSIMEACSKLKERVPPEIKEFLE